MSDSLFRRKLTVDEAIMRVAGNYRYQNKILAIFCLGQVSLSFFIMGMPYMFPYISCPTSGPCVVPPKNLNSATSEFELYGESAYKIGIIGSCYFAGMILGSIPLNWISDKYGRKILVKICTLLGSLMLAISGLSWSVHVFYFASFFMGAVEIGTYVSTFVLCTEIVESKYRSYYAGAFLVSWGVAAFALPFLYSSGISWRLVIMMSAALFFAEFALLKHVVESPRFLAASYSDASKAIEAFDTISITNQAGRFNYKLQVEENDEEKKEKISFLSFVRSKNNFVRFCICAFNWFSLILGYYGMVFTMAGFISDMYVEGAVMSAAEIFSTLVMTYFINVMGRKKCSVITFAVSGVCFFAIFLMQALLTKENADVGVVVMSGLARFAIGAQFFIIFIYTAELFPTRIRSLAYGICNFIGRIAGLVSSNLFEICASLGLNISFVFSVFLLVSAGLSTMLKETLNKKLDDSSSEEVRVLERRLTSDIMH